MAQNRFTRITPLQDTAQPFQLPIDQLALVLARQQGRYDEGETIANSLYDLSIRALPSQRPRANQILSDINQQVDDVVNEFDSDFARANRSLKNLQRQTNKLFSPGGEAAQIQFNFDEFSKHIQNQGERVGKEITSAQLANARSSILRQFGQAADFDPSTESFKSISPFLENIATNVDINSKAMDVAEKIVPQKLAEENFHFDPNRRQFIRKVGTSIEVLPAERINQIVLNSLASDGEIISLIDQNLRFAGDTFTPDKMMGILQPFAANAANAFQKNDQSIKQSLTVDPIVVANHRAKLRRDNIRFSKMLDLQLSQSALQSNVSTRYSPNFNVDSKASFKLRQDPLTGSLENIGDKTNVLPIFKFLEGTSDRLGSSALRDPRDEFKKFMKNGTSSGDSTLDLVFDALLKSTKSQIELDNPQMSQAEVDQLAANRLNNEMSTKRGFVSKLTKIGNEYNDQVGTAQATVVDIPVGVQDAITKQLIKSGLVQDQIFTFMNDKGQVKNGLSFSEMLDEAGVDREEFLKDATVAAYQTPMVNGSYGDLIYHPSVEGRIIVNDNSPMSANALRPIEQITQAYLLGNDEQFTVDLGHLLPESYMSKDENGNVISSRFNVRGFNETDEFGNINRNIVITNENGQNLETDFEFPIDLETLNRIAVEKIYNQGVPGVNTIAPLKRSKQEEKLRATFRNSASLSNTN